MTPHSQTPSPAIQRWAAVASVICALSVPALNASAQEIQLTGPLAGAPAVKGMRLYRDGRFQVAPFAGFTLQDEFDRTIFTGAKLQYHLADWLGVGVTGAFGAVHTPTTLTDRVATTAQATGRNRLNVPNPANFGEQIGKLQWFAALEADFIPLRGKLALFQSVFVDADFYLFGGVAFVGVEERADIVRAAGGTNTACDGETTTTACLQSQLNRQSRAAIAPTFGVGMSFHAAEFISLVMEWRAMPFAWNNSGTDQGGKDRTGDESNGGIFPDGEIDADDHILAVNHMVMIGLAVHLPVSVEVSE